MDLEKATCKTVLGKKELGSGRYHAIQLALMYKDSLIIALLE